MSISRFRSAIEKIKTSQNKAEAFSAFIKAYADVPENKRKNIFELILSADKKNNKCKDKLTKLTKAISFSHDGYTHFSVEIRGNIKQDQISLVRTIFTDKALINFLETIEYSDNNKVKFNRDTVDNLCALLSSEEKDEITKSSSLIEKAKRKVGGATKAFTSAARDLVENVGKKSSQSLYDDSPELVAKRDQLRSLLENHKSSPRQARKDASRPQSQPVLTSIPAAAPLHTRAASAPVSSNPPPADLPPPVAPAISMDTPIQPLSVATDTPPPPPPPSFGTPVGARKIPTVNPTQKEPEKRNAAPAAAVPTDHQTELARAIAARAKKAAESSEQQANEIEEKIAAAKQPPKLNDTAALAKSLASMRIPEEPSSTTEDDAFNDSPRPSPAASSETVIPFKESLVEVVEEPVIEKSAPALEGDTKANEKFADQNRTLKQLLDDLDSRQVYRDAISRLNFFAAELKNEIKSGSISPKQAAFIQSIWILTVELGKDSEATTKFGTAAADQLNTLIKDMFDGGKSEEDKIQSLGNFRNSAQAFIGSYATDNQSKQKWHKIIKSIIVSAAVLIGIGIGVGVTLATGGTMTLPYIGLLTGAYALLAGGAMGAVGGGLIGSVGASTTHRFFKPVDKQVDLGVATAINDVEVATRNLIKP